MNQFRKHNKPTFLDKVWNMKTKIFSRKLKKNIFFEYGSYLYRYGKNIFLQNNVYLKRNSIVGCANLNAAVYVGENTTIGNNSIIIASEKISIGKNCMIAPNVHIVDSNHGTKEGRAYNEQDNIVSKVHIGDNVWIGSGAIVLMGVSIGANSIVGAGSVVTKSFPENSLIIGSPAKLKEQG
jgi:acetyltransferase-like isoleucine patch superfamily enzyme